MAEIDLAEMVPHARRNVVVGLSAAFGHDFKSVGLWLRMRDGRRFGVGIGATPALVLAETIAEHWRRMNWPLPEQDAKFAGIVANARRQAPDLPDDLEAKIKFGLPMISGWSDAIALIVEIDKAKRVYNGTMWRPAVCWLLREVIEDHRGRLYDARKAEPEAKLN